MEKEMRLIDANALIDAIEDIDWYHVNAKGKLVDGANPADNTPIYKAFDIYNAIKNVPTVDAVEVVHGRWIETLVPDGYVQKASRMRKQCSVCGWTNACRYRYCPNCGAKMDGDGNA